MINVRHSRSFRSGFADGFASMFIFISGGRGLHAREADIVRNSWKEVGSALRESTSTQGALIDQRSKAERRCIPLTYVVDES